MEYCRSTRKLLAAGRPEESKALIRHWVRDIKLAPERLEVEITYKVPEHVGALYGSGGRI